MPITPLVRTMTLTLTLLLPAAWVGQNLRKMGGERWEEPVRDLDDLQNADWVTNATSYFLHLHTAPHTEMLTGQL